jgi:aconitate hydratase
MEPLEQLGFNLIGYGCTTCGGKSGPLREDVAAQIEREGLVVAAVLSGNRNFEGRIHKMIRANYIGSPPMVVLYALAGRIDIDLATDSLGTDRDGRPVFMRDLWPSAEEIEALLPLARDRAIYQAVYAPENMTNARWQALAAPSGPHFEWDLDSLYLVEPPFFNEPLDGDSTARLAQSLTRARVLCAFGDSLTTDHISPGGEIPTATPAGEYLLAAGVAQRDFNSYVGRRGNFHVMARATFANLRVKNALVPDVEGGYTRHFPDGAEMTIFDASNAYRDEGYAAIVLAGKEYGTGSSRDWAAKGSALLGVRAVIAESFERIHRANLIGMGVLPLSYANGASWKSLGLTGEESFEFANVENGVREGATVQVTARKDDKVIRFDAIPQVLTQAERRLLAEGGIPSSVLRDLLAA